MSEAAVLLVCGALAAHLLRIDGELAATRERLALLEERTKNPWRWGK